MTLQLPLGGPSDGGMSWANGIPGLILPSRFGTCARGHRKFKEEDVLENTGRNGLTLLAICVIVLETLNQREIGRHLSKVAQQVIERGETRIICVLGLGLEKTPV